ncbi:MAG: hypothetical protein HF312_15510 [Ignavibacteria bacterium]|jgi:hypothetical protein|nr:hypothetical protein [Ignavibacteria bacterium]
MQKPKQPQPETPTVIQGKDLFASPNYATDLIVPYLRHVVESEEYIWEPAVGEGKIYDRLQSYGFHVCGSDISGDWLRFNFVTDHLDNMGRIGAIVTNPPFSLKKKFVYKAIEYGLPFAFLIPCEACQWFLDAVKDYHCQILVPTRRIDFITPTGKSGKKSSAKFHSCWFTSGFNLPSDYTVVELSNETKKRDI